MTAHQLFAIGFVVLLILCAVALLIRMIVKGEFKWGL
jgi:hypothetical protein